MQQQIFYIHVDRSENREEVWHIVTALVLRALGISICVIRSASKESV